MYVYVCLFSSNKQRPSHDVSEDCHICWSTCRVNRPSVHHGGGIGQTCQEAEKSDQKRVRL